MNSKPNMLFLNRSFDKKRLKALLLWFRLNLSENAALKAVEILQGLGFRSATQGAISLGLDDLKTPTSKSGRVFQAQVEVALAHHEHHRGNRTPVELFQHLVDTWHRTSQDLTTEVVQLFHSTERVNPVYMMAFSGARGNISQVRQLVGMRGLMADPRGQIVGFPILSNFREGLTITEYFVSCYGARKGVVDTAIRTADAGYLTRRLADVSHHVVVRTTNCGTHESILLRDIKEGQKTILSLANRLVGRVLAEHVLLPANLTPYPEGHIHFTPLRVKRQELGSSSVSHYPHYQPALQASLVQQGKPNTRTKFSSAKGFTLPSWQKGEMSQYPFTQYPKGIKGYGAFTPTELEAEHVAKRGSKEGLLSHIAERARAFTRYPSPSQEGNYTPSASQHYKLRLYSKTSRRGIALRSFYPYGVLGACTATQELSKPWTHSFHPVSKASGKEAEGNYFDEAKRKTIIYRNSEITFPLASKLARHYLEVPVRSPLSCSLPWGVCQLCYGWGLSEGRRVTLGEAVGIIAAQSIGEPGTQLTLRTFHTGGVFSGELLNEIRAPYNGNVIFPTPLQGLLLRTPHGQIAFLTKVSGKMKIFETEMHFASKNENVDTSISLKDSKAGFYHELPVSITSEACTARQAVEGKMNAGLVQQGKPLQGEISLGDVASLKVCEVCETKEERGKINDKKNELGSPKQDSEFLIQPSTVIFVKQKEHVISNQLLAEFSSSNLQSVNDQIEITQQVLSETAGQIWFKELEYGNRKGPGSGSLGTYFSSQKLGGIWVLAGKPMIDVYPTFARPLPNSLRWRGEMSLGDVASLPCKSNKGKEYYKSLKFFKPFITIVRGKQKLQIENTISSNFIKETAKLHAQPALQAKLVQQGKREMNAGSFHPAVLAERGNGMVSLARSSDFITNNKKFSYANGRLAQLHSPNTPKGVKHYNRSLYSKVSLSRFNAPYPRGVLLDYSVRKLNNKSVHLVRACNAVQAPSQHYKRSLYSKASSRRLVMLAGSNNGLTSNPSLHGNKISFSNNWAKHLVFNYFVLSNLRKFPKINDLFLKRKNLFKYHTYGIQNRLKRSINTRYAKTCTTSIINLQNNYGILKYDYVLGYSQGVTSKKHCSASVRLTKNNGLAELHSFHPGRAHLAVQVPSQHYKASRAFTPAEVEAGGLYSITSPRRLVMLTGSNDGLTRNPSASYANQGSKAPAQTLRYSFISGILGVKGHTHALLRVRGTSGYNFQVGYGLAKQKGYLVTHHMRSKEAEGEMNAGVRPLWGKERRTSNSSPYPSRFNAPYPRGVLLRYFVNRSVIAPLTSHLYPRFAKGVSIRYDKSFEKTENETKKSTLVFQELCLSESKLTFMQGKTRGSSKKLDMLPLLSESDLVTFVTNYGYNNGERESNHTQCKSNAVQPLMLFQPAPYPFIGHGHIHFTPLGLAEQKKQELSFKGLLTQDVYKAKLYKDIGEISSSRKANKGLPFTSKALHIPLGGNIHANSLSRSASTSESVASRRARHFATFPTLRYMSCVARKEVGGTQLFPGQLVAYGDNIASNIVTTESGQVLYIDSQKTTVRKAQTVLIYSQAIIAVLSGDWIKKGTPLMSLSYQKLVTGDIVQGLPKIEQFFEAPVLRDGTFWSDSLQAKLNQFFQEEREKLPLAEAVRKGFSEIQRVLVEGVLRVYISQGVLIADKHLEVIVRQMTCKGRILYSGDTGFLRNELVSLDKIENVNQVTYGQKALYHPQVRGITDASLESESFLSAASFQETTRVLSRDAIIGKTDLMRGLKERVIVGELIQAGTGLANNSVYNLLTHSFTE